MNDLAPSERISRPWLTRACERMLAQIPWSSARMRMEPLAPTPRRMLVVKVHGMGDAILVRSVIHHLRQRNPALQIGVLAGDATSEVLSLGSDFRVHQYHQKQLSIYSSLSMLDEIRRCAYDAAISFEQGSLAGTGFLRATRIPRRAGFVAAGDRVKGSLLTHGLGFDSGASMWQSFLSLGRLADPELPDSLLPVPLPLNDEQSRAGASWLDERIANPSGRKVVLHLGSGAGQAFKRWPVTNFVALARELRRYDRNLSIILTGQPQENDLIRQFRSCYNGVALEATNLRSVAMTASVLPHCDLVVSNDTGLMHLGAAMGVPTVGLFGATTPIQWGPLGPAAAYVYSTARKCSPCIDSFVNRVPQHCTNIDYASCMSDVSVSAVLRAARGVITGNWLE